MTRHQVTSFGSRWVWTWAATHKVGSRVRRFGKVFVFDVLSCKRWSQIVGDAPRSLFFSGGSVFLRSPPHTYTLYTGPVGAYRLAAGKTTEQRARIWAGFGSVHTGGRISSSHTRCSEREWPAKTPGAGSVVRARLVRGPWRAHGSRHGGWVLNKAAETIPAPTSLGQ